MSRFTTGLVAGLLALALIVGLSFGIGGADADSANDGPTFAESSDGGGRS